MITILDVAIFFGAKADSDGNYPKSEFTRLKLPFMGGCINCGSTIAVYNACPSKCGHLRCNNEECLGDDGFSTVEEYNAIFLSPHERTS